MSREEKREQEKKKKAKYGMCSNVAYMLKRSWREARWIPFLFILLALLTLAENLLHLFVVPVILGELEMQASIGSLVRWILFFALGLMVTGASMNYIRLNTMCGKIEIRCGMMMDIHDKVCRTAYVNLDKQEFIQEREKAHRAVQDNYSAAEYVWETLSELLQNCLGFAVYLMLMTKMEWWIVAVTVITAVVSYDLTIWANRQEYANSEKEGAILGKLGYLKERTQDRIFAKDVRIFGMGEWLKSLHGQQLEKLYGYYKDSTKRYMQRHLAEALLAFLRNGIAYWYLIRAVLAGGIGVAEFLLLFSAVSGFSAWVSGILTSAAELHRQSQQISAVREFTEYEEPYAFENGKKLEPVPNRRYELELRDVSFRYPAAEKETISHMNLKIREGEKLAIVGVNGAGKTTLVKLLCGFYDPSEGQVLLNGQDIRQYNRRDYYKLFSAVFQEFSLLAGSVAMNVAQTDEEIDMARVQRCIEKAGLREKVEGMSGGYETNLNKEVYEDAAELSGGELQRLMLARALYKNGSITILDEPTAALDPLAERDMYQRYDELVGNGTSVYISHRLASTRFCDRVILMENGQIMEEGSHEQLLAAGGKYAALFEVQSRYYREDGGQQEGGMQHGE